LPARQAAGGTELYLLRNIDDPNEVIVLFEIEDLQKAREFVASDDLRERMQESRVIDKPDTYFLTT
jgi:heme-degrading monooxygenase HmoA